MSENEVPLRDAATIIVARQPAPSAALEFFMVKRHSKSSFMPDVHVYPGGALDPQDCTPRAREHVEGLTPSQARERLDEDIPEEKALGLFLAGVRETFEEAGLLLARRREESRFIDLTTDPEVARKFATYREQLNKGDISLTQVLHDEDLVVPLDRLGYFAHWITPYIENKRFDTRFFVVTAPENQIPLHDDAETSDSTWVSAQDALAAYLGGEISLAPPTLSTLVRLARHETLESLLDEGRALAPPTLLPHFGQVDGTVELYLPGHDLYPTPDVDARYIDDGPAPWPMMTLVDKIWRIPGHFPSDL